MSASRATINFKNFFIYPNMSTSVRAAIFQDIRKTLADNEVSLTKRKVLFALVTYAENSLKSSSIFNPTSLDRYNTYNNILNTAHLPDLML
jgi:hypothetical protein